MLHACRYKHHRREYAISKDTRSRYLGSPAQDLAKMLQVGREGGGRRGCDARAGRWAVRSIAGLQPEAVSVTVWW